MPRKIDVHVPAGAPKLFGVEPVQRQPVPAPPRAVSAAVVGAPAGLTVIVDRHAARTELTIEWLPVERADGYLVTVVRGLEMQVWTPTSPELVVVVPKTGEVVGIHVAGVHEESGRPGPAATYQVET